MTVNAAKRGTSLPYLFLASIAALFLEMTLIRWISTEIRLFAYVQNLALIACFLGFGLGCYHAGKKINYWLGACSTLLLVVIAGLPSPSWHRYLMVFSELLTLNPDSPMWAFTDPRGQKLGVLVALAVVGVAVLLLLLIGAMFPLGQYIGKALDEAEKPIPAYSVNLAGSLVGGWLLAGLSFLWTEPYLWFVVSFAFVLLLLPQARKFTIPVLLSLLLIPLGRHRTENNGLIWSPYQKLAIIPTNPTDFHVNVNNTGYMSLAKTYPGVNYAFSSYDSQFHFFPGRDRVLVVGAGGGNDIQGALRNGAKHVDAVEIDPAIAYIGKKYAPDHPYDNPNVTVYINDARNYMRTTHQKYDAIIFGLLDSHTVLSGQTNMRLDNYVYTAESLHDAMQLLKPDGVLVLKFEVRRPWLWIGKRFDLMMTDLTGRPPVEYYVPQIYNLLPASVFMTSKSDALWQRAHGNPDLARFLQEHPPIYESPTDGPLPKTSDDWPYIYHRSHSIPQTYLTIMLILVVISAVLFGRKLNAKASSTWHFMFLGAGFLCMETQLVSRSALYFGNTWMVNCFAVSMVLIVLVAANIFVEKKPQINSRVFFGILLPSLIVNYLIPWSKSPLGVTQTGLLLYFAYAVPLFCAGVIFSDSFRRCTHRSSALGANLFGATVGGVSQNLSFVFGLKALLLVSAVFYAGAWIFARFGAETSSSLEAVPENALAATGGGAD